jgi:hypothetical protein
MARYEETIANKRIMGLLLLNDGGQSKLWENLPQMSAPSESKAARHTEMNRKRQEWEVAGTDNTQVGAYE